MDRYEEKTKELIDLYISYSNKKSIKVDDFLKFRKQAIKEVNKEGSSFTPNVIHPLEDGTSKIKKKNEEKKDVVAIKKTNKVESTTMTKEIPISATETVVDVTPIQEVKTLSTEDMFLSMIKDIQD